MKEMDAFKKAVDGWRDTSANLIDHQKTMKTKARRVIAALFLDAGRDGFDWIKQGMIPLIQGGLQIDSLLRDEIAAVKAEREREALQGDFLDPEPQQATPQPGDRLTAEQMKDAPDGTVVRHPHDTTMRFERLDGKWYMHGTNTLPVDVLGGNFWPIVRWGNPS